MRYRIEHRTLYRYAQTVVSTQQTLRLSPRNEAHQRPLYWRLHAPGRLAAGVDGFGNLAHTHSLHDRHAAVALTVEGEVEIDPLHDGRLHERGALPPLVFSAPTPLTAADAALLDFTHAQLKRRTAAGLMDFALAVREAVTYRKGSTTVSTPAAQALAQGAGVCQDHAHVFIAGCRALGVPARYVSGYYYTPLTEQVASHAWADAWLAEAGWVSIDITHRVFASDALCRLAVGRDYDSASPVRGVRVGGGDEALEVRVTMRRLSVLEPAVPSPNLPSSNTPAPDVLPAAATEALPG
jgi:transglutaminase-like putative cysteine protease